MTDDRIQPGIRILLGTTTAIGPGKAALLTATGRAVLDLYRRMERQAVAALHAEFAELRTLMAPEAPE